MPKIISIQPANTETGVIDVTKARPYPYHIEAETGNVGRQDFWKGDPLRLMGFQDDANVQHVDVLYREFAADPQVSVGKFPVFMRADGSMYSMTLPVDSVTVSD
jgi:hypothetical protein